MNVSIDHPTDRPNFTEVVLGDLTIWFSYKTPIGYHTYAQGRVVRENVWGPTTGKHLNHISGSKDARVSGEEFEQGLAAVLASVNLGENVAR